MKKRLGNGEKHMSSERREHGDCAGCACFLKSCIAVIDVNYRMVKVYDVCCRSCIERYKTLVKSVRVSVG